MTRFAIISDLHIWNHRLGGGADEAGLNERARLALLALRTAVVAAGDAHLVVAGDVFHQVGPSPQLLTATRNVLLSGRLSGVTLVVGNHDRHSAQSGDHALGPLEWQSACDIEVVEAVRTIRFGPDQDELVVVPFRTGRPSDWLPGVLKELCPDRPHGRRVVVSHLGIVAPDSPPWAREAVGAADLTLLRRLIDQHAITYWASGDWHDARDYGPIAQIGASIPHSWNELSAGRMLVVEAAEMRSVLLTGPRFCTDIGTARRERDRGCRVFYRERVAAGRAVQRRIELEAERFRFVDVVPIGDDLDLDLGSEPTAPLDLESVVTAEAKRRGRPEAGPRALGYLKER